MNCDASSGRRRSASEEAETVLNESRYRKENTHIRRPAGWNIRDPHVLRTKGDEGVNGRRVVELDKGSEELASLRESDGRELESTRESFEKIREGYVSWLLQISRELDERDGSRGRRHLREEEDAQLTPSASSGMAASCSATRAICSLTFPKKPAFLSSPSSSEMKML